MEKYDIKLITQIKGSLNNIHLFEKYLHDQYKNFKYKPLIKFGGSYSECFNSIDNISYLIKSYEKLMNVKSLKMN